MPSNDDKIKDTMLVGRAVYCEFVLKTNPDASVFQLLITPEAQSKLVPSMRSTSIAYRRQLTNGGPKKQWRWLNPSLDEFAADADALKRRTYLNATVERLHHRGFVVLKQPLVVDVSEHDLEDICRRQTPYKLIGRVLKVRRKHGFPTTFIK